MSDPRTLRTDLRGLAAQLHRRQPAQHLAVALLSGPERFFRVALIGQTLVMAVTLRRHRVSAGMGLQPISYCCCSISPFCGLAFPNAAAMALAPFSQEYRQRFRLFGFMQMGIGAIASTGVGLAARDNEPADLCGDGVTAVIGLVILLANQNRVTASPGLAGWSSGDQALRNRATRSTARYAMGIDLPPGPAPTLASDFMFWPARRRNTRFAIACTQLSGGRFMRSKPVGPLIRSCFSADVETGS